MTGEGGLPVEKTTLNIQSGIYAVRGNIHSVDNLIIKIERSDDTSTYYIKPLMSFDTGTMAGFVNNEVKITNVSYYEGAYDDIVSMLETRYNLTEGWQYSDGGPEEFGETPVVSGII